MKTQLRIPFERINWDLFCKRGAILACFDRDRLVLGMGESLAEGEFAFFQQDFFNRRHSRYIPEILCFVDLEDFKLPAVPSQKLHIEDNEDEVYLSDLEKALASFNKDFEKVVLISREYYSREGVSFLGLLGALIKGNLGHNYGLWDENGGILGSTPEILFSKKGRHFSTMALASTRPYEKKDELLSDKKELFEHRLVIDDIKNKLQEQEEVRVEETRIERFGNLAHLRTDISFSSSMSSGEMILNLSPTAALGGYPKERAREFIQASSYHQKYPNRNFGGVVGIESGDETFALVAIRNIQWDSERYWIECGGGVVKESVIENELAEVRRKRATVRELFFGAHPEIL